MTQPFDTPPNTAAGSASRAVPKTRLAIRGDLLDFTADPGLGPDAHTRGHVPAGVRFRPDHWLLIEDDRIVGAQPAALAPDARWQRIDHAGRLLMPGFIDTHVHCPQLDVIASYGTELLDWLETYTFPAEARYADPEVAQAGATRFLDALLGAGTTSAAVFPTVHAVSAEALFAQAQMRGMRLITGKVLMDCNAPANLRDDVDQAERDCADLIARWHGRDRLAYAVTPRFAATSTPAQLAMAGRLCAAHPDVYMQTHVAESRAEVAWIAELFAEARSYLDVYDRVGLLHPRAILAHGIWLDDPDRARLHDSGAQLAFCPSSNLFLGSGLFDWRAAEDAQVQVSIATDVGGGTSLSMLRTLGDAYKVQALRGVRLSAWKALYTATRGAAHTLGLAHEIGSLEAGACADLAIWDWAAHPVARHRDTMARDLHERLFAWMTLGDERNLAATFVAGVLRYARPTAV